MVSRVGLEDVDDVYTRITNGVRDAILPDVTIFVKYTLEDGEIIKMEIGEGSYKPYYLKVKGLKPLWCICASGHLCGPRISGTDPADD